MGLFSREVPAEIRCRDDVLSPKRKSESLPKRVPPSTAALAEFGAGDLVVIPKGLSCTWDVSVAVDKHYKFDSSSPPPPS
ncbi:hypothetical protein C3L33_07344, partial [Rhododendron williamsianum]